MGNRTALLFPGQGSQRIGMLDGLAGTPGLERLLDAAEALSGLDLASVAAAGPADKLAATRYAQPLLYLADWAWGRALLHKGVVPAAVAGHSLGEYAALAIAGVFSVEAGLELVIERSRCMAEHVAGEAGTMAAVLGLDASVITRIVSSVSGVWVANDNSESQVVISGLGSSVAAVIPKLTEAGARRVIPLAVTGAFHTPAMAGAEDCFAETLLGAEFSDAKIPVYQNTDPTPAVDAMTIRSRLLGQMTSPVRWAETMRALAADGVDTVIEAGPGNVLTGLAKRVDGVRALAVEAAGIDAVAQEVS